jgi:uncharacterized protein YjiK
MPGGSLRRTVVVLVLLLLLLIGGLLGQQWRLYELATLQWQEWRSSDQLRQTALWLPDYRVEIEAKPIAGFEDISALTFDPERRSLFTVTNENPELIELSLSGEVLRRIPLSGFGDVEAVEFISPGIYVISDERSRRLFRVHVDDSTQWLDAADSEQLNLNSGRDDNKGIEGLAYDPLGHRLFVAKERDPLRILVVEGFPRRGYGPAVEVSVQGDQQRDGALQVRDLSALQFEERTGHLLALSDESRLVLELDLAGQAISSLLLWPGMHGLRRWVPQPEGLAMDDQGVLYLVSEPNLFYRFVKNTAP